MGASYPTPSYAQEKPADPKKEQPQKDDPKQEDSKKDDKKEEQKKDEPKKDPKVADYEKAIKDLKRVDGDFPLYIRKKDILLELPEDKVGKIFLMQAAFDSSLDGFLLHAGMPFGSDSIDAFRFDRNEDNVWLVRPNIKVRWDDKDPFIVGVERTFQEAVLGSYKIEQQNPEKKLLLVNVTNLFYGDVLRLSETIASMLGGPYGLDREKSGIDRVDGYPENTVVAMKLNYVSPRGAQGNPLAALFGIGTENTLEDDRSAPVRVVYNVWFRRDEGYKPRLADPRVGYFTNDSTTFAKYTQSDSTQSFINRFNLVKKDPSAKLSEPVKPIVWTVDPSIPSEYRDAVKKGVMFWNRAFEAAGYKNAIKVQDPDPNDKNYHHADGRYNVIRLSPSLGSPFAAIALPRTDPFTGQVYNASVTLDGGIFRDLMSFHNDLSPKSMARAARAKDVLLRSADRKMSDDRYLFEPEKAEAELKLKELTSRLGWNRAACTYASDKALDTAVAWYATQEVNGLKVSKEEFVKRYIEDCVAHEVGHCLGLRHNFAGSTNLTTKQLSDDSLTDADGVAASVMDYTPPNALAVLKGNGNFFNTGIGPYDVWAIQYGYTPFSNNEKFELNAIARQSGKPGLAYMTDEDADSWNPYAVRFDLASDPLNYSEKALEAFRRARINAIRNLPKPGEPYSKRTEVVMASIVRAFKEGRNAARFIGGVRASRTFKGDVGEKATLKPIDAATQRQATSLIVRNFLQEKSFDLPTDVLNSLSMTESGGWTAPLRDVVGGFQQNLAALMMSASTTDRIAENAFKTRDGHAYNLDEHYGTIVGATFSEVGKDVNIAPLRRDLQKFVLNGLMVQAGAPAGNINEDVRTVTSDLLRRLAVRFDAASKSTKLDGMTRVHLRDCAEQAKRFLNREAVSR
jgi:hypothetical protein